ncbi:MAG TPA: hypothetical protein PKI33_03330 [Anaerolineales bacterium]|mgnify:FL=1|nr:hypothetical protein [Anaerolineales bacterium]HNF93151.1 hypothetical protein [Anaerolineales bacterium]HNM36064.1 hypothetical protein [Anaerolineales bacterium]
MSNVSDIKPWFREDIARTLMSIYFASAANNSQRTAENENYRVGFAAALSSVALAVGVNPESFLAPEDIQRLRSTSR